MIHQPQTISPRRAVVIRVFARYASFGYPLTYWEACALSALMQGGGLNLGLDFEPSARGLGSDGVMRVLVHLEGMCFDGFLAHRLDKPFTVERLALKQTRLVLNAHKQHHDFVLKIAQLIAGFESPMGLWLLSSVWWLRVQKTLPWPAIRQTLSSTRPSQGTVASTRHLDAAYTRLEEKGWLNQNSL